MSMNSMVQVNQVCFKILFINRLQFLVDSNDVENIYIFTKPDIFGPSLWMGAE